MSDKAQGTLIIVILVVMWLGAIYYTVDHYVLWSKF
jgi:hypothetical protein